MATCNISAPFDITIEGADLNVAKTFTAPRAFTVVGCTVFNAAAATGTVTLTGATAGVFTAITAAPPTAGAAVIGSNATGAGGEPTQSAAILAANASIAKDEVITVLASAVTITQVVLHCVASGLGEAITIS